MATFCINCGSPLGNSAFCPQCGKPTGATPNPAPSAANPAYAAPMAPAARGGSGVKILIIVLCFLAIGGVTVVGALFWAAHRVKQAIVQKAEENGVDLGSLSRTGNSSDYPLPKACELLPKEDVARLIGEPIERAEVKNNGCEYYGPAGLSAKLAQDEAANAVQQGKASGADATNAAIELQRMLNRAGAQAGNAEAGPTGSGGELPLLVVEFGANGKAAMSALKFSKAILGAASKAVANSQGENTSGGDKTGDVFVGTDVAGLGDKAMWMPNSGLYVLKGDMLIKVNPGLFHDSKDKGIAVAKAVLAKI